MHKFLGIGIICFGILMGITTKSGFSLGSSMFQFFGLQSWSREQIGLYYPGILSIVLIVLGVFMARKHVSFKNVFIIILAGILVAPFVVSWGKVAYLKTSTGINAMEYNRKQSNFKVQIENGSEIITIRGNIKLTNHGNEKVSFYMVLRPRDHEKNRESGWFVEDIELYEKNINNDFVNFVLEPGQSKSIDVYSEIPNYNQIYYMEGNLNGPDLVIYNEHEKKHYRT